MVVTRGHIAMRKCFKIHHPGCGFGSTWETEIAEDPMVYDEGPSRAVIGTYALYLYRC